MTDYKQLCAELLNAYEHELNKRGMGCDLINRARAALAQPEPEGPSDEELYDLFDWLKDEWHSNDEREFPLPLFARAVLARWGRPVAEVSLVAQPADGEVAELVAALSDPYIAPLLHERTRAAELLSQLAPVQPVSVGERLPGPEDCDAKRRCWIYMPDIGTAPSWRLVDPRDIGPYHTHWLPAHALPVP
jgi:hypothetical protein